jgi:glycosyltransferase involved in cell wall biosynthesis
VKITVLGIGPLPGQQAARIHAPGLRTAQFVRGLLNGGHEVSLVMRLYPNAGSDPNAPLPADMSNVRFVAMDDEQFMTGAQVSKLLAKWKPRALVGVTLLPAFRAIQVASDLPVWVDLFGDPLAEGQAKAALLGDDDVLQSYYDLLMPILQRGDRFSTVSRAQASALEGQLSLTGRVSRKTAYYRMTHTIPCSLDPLVAPAENSKRRGDLVPKEAFVVFWSGGFNTWCDVDTLFLGLEKAMSSHERIHFVATGADLGEQDASTFAHFSSLVERSSFRDRYHLLGWVDYSELPDLHALADVAVNSDRPLLEVRLGTKTRFMEWIACKIPIITSRLSELSRELERHKAALAYAPGDAEALAQSVLHAGSHEDDLAKMAAKAYSYAASRLSFEHTTRSVVQWGKRPRRAPDWRRRPSLAQASEAKLRNELELTHQHVGNLDVTIDGLKGALAAAQQKAERTTSDVNELKAQVEHEKQKAANWESEISKIIADRDHWKEVADKTEQRRKEQEEDFNHLRESLEQQMAQQKEFIDEVGKQLRYFDGLVRKRDAKVADIENKMAAVRTELAESQALANSRARELDRVKAELAAREEQVAELMAWGEKVRSTILYRLFNLVRRGKKSE